MGGIEGFTGLIGFALNVDREYIFSVLNRESCFFILQQFDDITVKMVGKNETGMVSPPTRASEGICFSKCRNCGEQFTGDPVLKCETCGSLLVNRSYKAIEATAREFSRRY